MIKMNENEWSGSESNDNGYFFYWRIKLKFIVIVDIFGLVIK